jgi:hypothetical protein
LTISLFKLFSFRCCCSVQALLARLKRAFEL